MKTTGKFETSNPLVNQIYKNAYWGIRGNYRGMPTDCPQRDERHGWLGDRVTGAYGEAFIFNNIINGCRISKTPKARKEASPTYLPVTGRYTTTMSPGLPPISM